MNQRAIISIERAIEILPELCNQYEKHRAWKMWLYESSLFEHHALPYTYDFEEEEENIEQRSDGMSLTHIQR